MAVSSRILKNGPVSSVYMKQQDESLQLLTVQRQGIHIRVIIILQSFFTIDPP